MNANPLSLWSYRELLIELVKREIKARYKQSILGYAWVILVPLINLVVLTIVFSFFIKVPTGNIPYPVFLFVALVPWTFTANAITFATQSLVSNSNLVTKIYLPREIFPTASVIARMVDFLLTFMILSGVLIFSRIHLSIYILYVPLIFFIQVLLILGIGYILSCINVFYRDVENVIGVFLTFWMYITPVLYPKELIPDKFLAVFTINPMLHIVNSYRNVLLYETYPDRNSILYAFFASLVIFLVGYIFFKSRSRYFADVI